MVGAAIYIVSFSICALAAGAVIFVVTQQAVVEVEELLFRGHPEVVSAI
jgi:hypothetical protein